MLTVLVAVVAVVVAAASSKSSNPSNTEAEYAVQARGYIKEHGADAYTLQNTLETVEIQVGALDKSEALWTVNRVAEAAQGAIGELHDIRDNFGIYGNSGYVEKASVRVFYGANSLTGAIESLLGYTRAPNPATLAQFKSKYTAAKDEWDEGVTTMWRLAHRSKPPILRPHN